MIKIKKGLVSVIGYDWKIDAKYHVDYIVSVPFEVAEIITELYDSFDEEYFDEYLLGKINAYPEIEEYVKGYTFETLEEFFINHSIGKPVEKYLLDEEEVDEKTFWDKNAGGFNHWCEDLTYTNIEDEGSILIAVSRG